MAPKIGIALGSGSARGWSHIGVMQSFSEAGIAIDYVCGTSIGALVAAAYAAGFLEPLKKWATQLSWSNIIAFMDVKIPRSGIIEGAKISGYLREIITDPLIENLSVPFAAVSTDLKSGKEVWLREGSLIEAVRASMSLPGIFTPCEHNGRWLVDGGLVNPVPVSLCRAMGADIVIAVDLNSDIMNKARIKRMAAPLDDDIDRVASSSQSRWSDFLKHSQHNGKMKFFGQIFQEQPDRSPTLFEVLATSVNIMQHKITQQRLLDDKPDIVIRPKLADLGLMEFNRATEAIDEGIREVNGNLSTLKDIIDHKKVESRA
jgi:NTE family protein